MIKVMVCDDHQLLREGVIKIINTFTNCKVIAEASQGEEAINLIETGNKPDILLLDIHMPPGMNGYEVVKHLQGKYNFIKVIGFSAYNDIKAIIGMASGGAKGFISKAISKEMLEKAIKQVSKGFIFFEPELTAELFSLNESNLYKKKGIHSLTMREFEVARLMASDKPYKQIAEELSISTSTLENIRIRIFEKSGAKTRTEVALFMIKTGLIN